MSVGGHEPVRRVVVLRHGVTAHNAGGVVQGHLDTPLAEDGREQARAVAPVIAAMAPCAVITSDLSRAADTADLLAAACGLTARPDARFREVHGGQWQGLTIGEIAERFPQVQEAMWAGQDIRRGQTGERVSEVAARARQGLEEVLAAESPEATVVVVTHGVTGRALVADLVGMPQRIAWLGFAGLDNCGWALVEQTRGRWRVRVWNATVPPDRSAHRSGSRDLGSGRGCG